MLYEIVFSYLSQRGSLHLFLLLLLFFYVLEQLQINKDCKNRTENSHTLHIPRPLLITVYISVAQLIKLIYYY